MLGTHPRCKHRSVWAQSSRGGPWPWPDKGPVYFCRVLTTVITVARFQFFFDSAAFCCLLREIPDQGYRINRHPSSNPVLGSNTSRLPYCRFLLGTHCLWIRNPGMLTRQKASASSKATLRFVKALASDCQHASHRNAPVVRSVVVTRDSVGEVPIVAGDTRVMNSPSHRG